MHPVTLGSEKVHCEADVSASILCLSFHAGCCLPIFLFLLDSIISSIKCPIVLVYYRQGHHENHAKCVKDMRMA